MCSQTTRRRVGFAVAIVFAIALFCGTGPGILWVNESAPVSLPGGLKLPRLYAWGLLWYAVEAACVIVAYKVVWTDDEPGDGPDESTHVVGVGEAPRD